MVGVGPLVAVGAVTVAVTAVGAGLVGSGILVAVGLTSGVLVGAVIMAICVLDSVGSIYSVGVLARVGVPCGKYPKWSWNILVTSS